VFVAKVSFISFNNGFGHIRPIELIMFDKVVLHALLRLSLTPTLQRVDGSLDEATVFG